MKATFNATVRAYASLTNPLQTQLDIVLTDFQPNGNNQCIPIEEANNLVESALNQPLKMNFVNGKEAGHDQSYCVGTLKHVYLDGDVIRAKAVLWKTEFHEEDQYLKQASAEGKTLQTSWEIFYKQSEEKDGIQYLRDTAFGATVIVENPAYGGRTPILSIAEQKEENRLKVEKAEREKALAQTMEELEKLRSELNTFYDWITDLYSKTYQIEEAEKQIKEPAVMSDRMNKVSNRIVEMLAEYAELKQKLETVEASKAELEKQIVEVTKEKEETAKAEKLKTRTEKLELLGVEDIDPDFISAMKDEDFDKHYNLILTVAKKAKSSTEKIFIPEPKGSSDLSDADLIKALNERNKK